MRRLLCLLAAIVLAGSAHAASTINSLPQITPFPLTDPGCPANSTENLWISRGTGPGGDFRITPTQLGYVFQGPTAPACPFRYQFWWNNSVNPPQYQVFDGVQWLTIGALNFATHVWSLPNPVISGTVTGTYTLGGTVSITSPTIGNPVFSGTATGTYTLAGTIGITSPTISNPTITGTVTGSNVFSLSALSKISAYKILGNPTGALADVTAGYTASGTGATLASTTGSFLAGDITVSADVSGTVQASSSFGSTIFYRFPNPGGSNTLEILNSGTGASTAAILALATGTANNSAGLVLTDAAAALSRFLTLQIGSATGGGIVIDSSGGGAAAKLALTGGSNADGITLAGTPEVLYNFNNSGANTQFRVFNNFSAASTTATLMAQTGTGGATIGMQMLDGGTPTGNITTGAGVTGGLKLIASTGPITLLPSTGVVPQVSISNTNAGAATNLQVTNNSSAANTTASLIAVTGTVGNFIQMEALDGGSPGTFLVSGVGATAGLTLQTFAGPIRITPGTATPPQTVVGPTVAGGATTLQVTNASTTGGSTANLQVATGTANSFAYFQVAETSHNATISIGAGVTGGLTVTSASGGAAADLTLASGRDVIITPLAAQKLTINNLATVAAGTGKHFLCIDTATNQVFDGTGASCN